MVKKAFIFFILISFLIGGGFFLLFRQRENVPPVTKTIHIKGKLIPPASVPRESFEIVSLAEVNSPSNNGEISSRVYENGVTIVGAMVKDKEFGLIRVVVTKDSKPTENFVIDAKSTAVGLVFATPYLVTNSPDKTGELLTVIENNTKVQELAVVIERAFNINNDFLDNTDYQQAAKEAVESVLAALNP